MTQLNHVRQAVAAALFLGLSALGQAQTLVGQTNQDIDLFLTTPAIPANRPNVLIVWDNTANWGQQINGQTAYSFEASALRSMVQALSDQFNVGLMLFAESGAGANIKGGQVIGASDEFGYKATVEPHSTHDLHATILHLLGMDHTRLTYSFNGRSMRLTDVYGELIPQLVT